MRNQSRAFLEALVSAPGPSGYEGPVRQVWKDEASKYADRVVVDVHGNAMAVHHEKGKPRLMLAGHMDELGFQVRHVDKEGYVYFDTIGGFDLGMVPGRKVRIHTGSGPVLGVIGKKPIHLMTGDELKKVPEKHELWIDLGAKDDKEANKLVAIGDPITYDANFEVLRKGLLVSRGFDDKMGAYVVAEALRAVAQGKKECKAAVWAVATVQEEVGLRGARTSTYGIDPLVGIAVDVTFATDHPGMDKRRSGDVKIGGGPVVYRGANINPVVFDRLVETAKRHKITHQIASVAGGTGTDANAMQLSRAGVATGLVSVPLRYMHTPVEVLSQDDLDHTVALLKEFALLLNDKMSFIP
jgi:endoglucanase